MALIIAAVAGFATGAPAATVTRPLGAAVALPGHTDQLLERLIAQDVLNASLLTELLQLLRHGAAAAQAEPGDAPMTPDNVGGAVRLLNSRINGQKGAGVNGESVGMVH